MRDGHWRQRSGRIVIVEPHDDSRAMYADYFRSVGFQVTAVPTAAAALRAMSREPPDAIVTCLRLRGMDGFALCEALSALPDMNRIPVIGVSTCVPDHERAMWDPGFATVRMKPCLPDVLVGVVRDALAAESPGEAVRHRSASAMG